jgi:hypothetical protein
VSGARLLTLALGVFFTLATTILLTVGIALLVPGTAFDAIWSLKPERQPELMAWRTLAGPGFLALSVPMLAAGVGCFLRRPWARWLAMAIFAANGVGDAVQLVLGHWLEGAIGVTVAGFLIVVLWRSKAAFHRAPDVLARESGRL